jgi:hypothetical protein
MRSVGATNITLAEKARLDPSVVSRARTKKRVTHQTENIINQALENFAPVEPKVKKDVPVRATRVLMPGLSDRMNKVNATNIELALQAGISEGTVNNARQGKRVLSSIKDLIDQALKERFPQASPASQTYKMVKDCAKRMKALNIESTSLGVKIGTLTQTVQNAKRGKLIRFTDADKIENFFKERGV